MQQQYGITVDIPLTTVAERGFDLEGHLHAFRQHESKKVGLVPDGEIQFL